MRRKGRVDSNQKEIVDRLRKWGCSVAVTSSLGEGFPDIVVGYEGLNFLFEIKRNDVPPSQSRLTPDEVSFFEKWDGQADVIKTFEEAQEIIIKKNLPI